MKLDHILIKTGEPTTNVAFKSPENCGGEVIIADIFITNPESIEEIVEEATVSTGNDVGRNKGELLVIDLDFTGISSGSYYLKIYTAETGVLAKGVVTVQ